MSARPLRIALVLVGLQAMMLVPTQTQAQQPDTFRSARDELHDRGVVLFRQGRYREAVQAFHRADRIRPSAVNRWNIMRCYQELGEHSNALRALDGYLQMPEISAADRVEAERRREEITQAQRVAAFSGTPHSPTSPPSATPPPLPSAAGSPRTERNSPSFVGPLVVLGAGVAVALAGLVLDIAAYVQSDPSYYLYGDDQFSSEDSYEEWRSSCTDLALAGDILLGVGGAIAVGGLVWVIVTASRRRSSRASTDTLNIAAGHDGIMLRVNWPF